MAEDPILAPYIRGRLALAGIDLSVPSGVWLDSVYAAYAEAPHEVLAKMSKEIIRGSAKLRPEEARKTWGQLPEHRALAGNLGRGRGAEAGGTAGMPPATGRQQQQAYIDQVRRMARTAR
jgi:hypothetical protein